MVRLGARSFKTKTLLSRVKNTAIAGVFAVVQLTPAVVLPAKAAAATTAPTNPTLTQACGLDIALVIDNSNSIDNGEMTQIKNAMTGFTNALNGTPTQFSVTRFGTSATVLRNFTANVGNVNSSINGISTGGGGTNWEDGLLKASGTFDPRADKPNLVIFASDGNPTYRNDGNGGIDGNGSSDPLGYNLDNAVVRANAIKSAGTRILALGIGDDLDVNNLKAISGPNANTGNVLTSDVITSNFATLASDLAAFAQQTCGGTITTQKLIDADGNPNTTDDRTPAAGWTFDINGSPSNPAAEATAGVNGQTSAVKVQAGTYSVNETPQAGYDILSASCTGANANGSRQGNSIVGITVADSNIVSCVFVNAPSKGSVKVDKKLDLDGDGTYESGNSEAQARNIFWNLDGGSNTTFGGTISNVAVGSHTVNETSVVGYHFTGWYPTMNTQQQSCANPAGTTLPVNITVNSGVATAITLCNQRDTGNLKVVKKVINNNGGTADADDFTLYVKKGSTNVSDSPAAGSASGKTYKLPTDTYTVSEDAKTGYAQTSLVCKDDVTGNTVTHPVVLARDQKVTCTITNDDKAPTVTVTKKVVNPYGVPLSPTAFPLYIDGTPVVSGTPYTQFNAGWRTISEDQQTGYEFGGVSGDCQYGNDVISILLSLDAHATCTITNTAIQPKLIVKKKVINDNSGTKSASDFTMVVSGNSAVVPNFPGSSFGQSVGLNEGSYNVTELGAEGYNASFSADCSGTISVGQTKTCVITNNDKANPSIHVEKFGPGTAHESDEIVYVFKVTNTGDTTLDNVNISDDIASNETCDDTSLNIGQTTTCTATYTVPSPQIAHVVNTVTAEGTDPDDTTVTDTDDHIMDVLHPSINVEKTGPNSANAGDTVTYTFTVTNTGDVPLSIYSVEDSITGDGEYVSGDTNLNDVLDLDETWIFTGKYTIPVKQTAPVVNTVTACGYEQYYYDEEDDRDDVLERLVIQDDLPIALPPANARDCASDSHTLTINQVLGASISTPTLAVTGQAVSQTTLVALFVTSTLLVAAALRGQRNTKTDEA